MSSIAEDSHHENIRLDAHALVSGILWEVEIIDGEVWLTASGDIRDYILKEGDTFSNPKGRHLVIEALTAAQLRVIPKKAQGRRPFYAWFVQTVFHRGAKPLVDVRDSL